MDLLPEWIGAFNDTPLRSTGLSTIHKHPAFMTSWPKAEQGAEPLIPIFNARSLLCLSGLNELGSQPNLHITL